jgi:hypothetical protein
MEEAGGLLLSKNHGEEGHPDKDPISRLPEIGCSGIIIHIRADLIDPWERMEDDDFLIKSIKEGSIYDVTPFDPLIL